jgi:hypothetical protein
MFGGSEGQIIYDIERSVNHQITNFSRISKVCDLAKIIYQTTAVQFFYSPSVVDLILDLFYVVDYSN